MDRSSIPNGLQRFLVVSCVFIFISTFIILLIGGSLSAINKNIKKLNVFLLVSQDVQFNFEKSLQMYTESTEKIIEYLLSLRPDNEKGYIAFISSVEDIGRELSLNLNLQSSEVTSEEDIQNGFHALYYDISFFGSASDLENFLRKLEDLSYFVKVLRISFTNPVSKEENDDVWQENVNIKIKFYIKQS